MDEGRLTLYSSYCLQNVPGLCMLIRNRSEKRVLGFNFYELGLMSLELKETLLPGT